MMPARRLTGDRSIRAADGCVAVVSYIPPDLATRAGGGLRASPDAATMPWSPHQGDHGTMPLSTSLQKAFNTTLNDLGAEMALIALKEDGFGPFVSHSNRGFTPREIQAVVRALSHPEVGLDGAAGNGNARQRLVRIRMTAPSHRSLLTIPLEVSKRIYGALVIGRKDIVTFSDKDRRNLTEAAGELEAALVKAGVSAPAAGAPAAAAAPPAPRGAGGNDPLMAPIPAPIPYDRALLTRPEPASTTLTSRLPRTPGHCEWRGGPNRH